MPGIQARAEAWAAYTAALGEAVGAERALADAPLTAEEWEQAQESLAEARRRTDALLWTTPEGFVSQKEYRTSVSAQLLGSHRSLASPASPAQE